MTTFLRYYIGAVGLAIGVFLLRVPSEKTRPFMLTMPPKVTGGFFVFWGGAAHRLDSLRRRIER